MSSNQKGKGKGKKGKESNDNEAPVKKLTAGSSNDASKGKSKGKGKDKGKGKGGDNDKDKFGKGKGGKKGKGKGKLSDSFLQKRKKKLQNVQEALEDCDFNIQKLSDRQRDGCIQGVMDPKELKAMRDKAIAEANKIKAQHDAATFKRQYKCHLSVTAIQNSTDVPWNVFMAVSMAKVAHASERDKVMKANYSYSRSYIVPAGEKKKFKSPEKVYTKAFIGSYKDLKHQELRLDLWIVVNNNFNQHLGVATRNLYECGSAAVYQQVLVKGYQGTSGQAFDVGQVYLSAMVSEVFTYGIVMQNWQYIPPGAKKDGSSKTLCIKVPSGTGAIVPHTTDVSKGPRFGWRDCGQFAFEGTKIALACASFEVEVFSNGGRQGKSVISLGGAGDYPIATGSVKAMTDNVKAFDQGRVGGGITLTTKSKAITDDEALRDSEPSIPAPIQPGSSVVMYHLDPHTQYLLVEVNSAESLPVADFDLGTSHPFVRVRYDGMVQQSPVIEGSLRPVWNHLFYIPVRYIENDIRTNPRYQDTLLPEEIKSKGFLEIEIWHMDGVPTEFLGCFKLDLRMTRFGNEEERSICAKMNSLEKAGDDSDDEEHAEEHKQEEEETQGIHKNLMKKHKVKVFHASRQKLVGTRLVTVSQPKVSFSCCFCPDFPPDVDFPEQPTEVGLGRKFRKAYDKWNGEYFGSFNEDYYAWYPDAPPARTWPCSYLDMRGEDMPMPYLLSALALPASLSQPGQVLHWVRCLEFQVPSKQKSKGKIDRWQPVESTLALRKGSIQDHAVLLCAALLGVRKDAWVVKGTTHGNQEHCWVMTREKGGCVTFWETSTGAKYHLPGRWSDDVAHGPKMMQMVKARDTNRKIRPDWKEHARARRDGGRRVQLCDLDDLARLPFSPHLALVKPDKIVPLPYQSIEVVFNTSQLYGNQGNHSPACIYYDMEQDKKCWREFLDTKEQALISTGKRVAIPIGPCISAMTAEELAKNIDSEVRESIRMTRIRKGFESVFEESEELHAILLQYLEVLEQEIKLDIDWRTNAKGQPEKSPGHPSPFNSPQYVDAARKAWGTYWRMKENLDDKRKYLPVRENHILSGVPFHFSGTDIKEVRYHIMACRPILEYVAIPDDDVVYFSCTKVFPMANSIASVWSWIGVQMPLDATDIFELASAAEANKNASRKGESVSEPKAEKEKEVAPKKAKAKVVRGDG